MKNSTFKKVFAIGAAAGCVLGGGYAVNANKNYLLITSVMDGHSAAIPFLAAIGASKELMDASIHMPIHNKDSRTLSALIKSGATPNPFDLWYAGCHGHVPSIRILLDQGLDINGNEGMPVNCAAMEGHTEAVKYLIARGADVTLRDNAALRIAEKAGRNEAAAVIRAKINFDTAPKAPVRK